MLTKKILTELRELAQSEMLTADNPVQYAGICNWLRDKIKEAPESNWENYPDNKPSEDGFYLVRSYFPEFNDMPEVIEYLSPIGFNMDIIAFCPIPE